nr:hypothetical protein [Tanacetum cinerariifolium]
MLDLVDDNDISVAVCAISLVKQLLRPSVIDPFSQNAANIKRVLDRSNTEFNWKRITSMLLDENPSIELKDDDATNLTRLFCASVKKAAGETIILAIDHKMPNHTKAQNVTGSKDRPPMLAPGNYVQWKSRIKRYIDTKPNHELIHYCLENPPYKLDWQDIEVPVSKGSLITTTERIRETYKNVSQDIKDQLNAEVEAIQIILTGIHNDIYSTVDACPNACVMWKAIERLKQGKSINVQDLETNLYWEFRKFTSQDGESLESYYSRFYKMMNELIKNQYKVTNHQVNVQFLLQLQPEWQRGKAIVNSPQPIYDQEPSMVAEDDKMSKDKEID